MHLVNCGGLLGVEGGRASVEAKWKDSLKPTAGPRFSGSTAAVDGGILALP
ncbi:hypothetical protein OsJ_33753 [Oryza sativa Japonica Group]|jgi:hypothetical protein|uniref:Uncharacterized protein n=1 Tax=Oryza sativa subsp. japonica TaxID=39947 RepID=B9GAH6_ORYSJ|nr:hypothetical protein OsJ_33753 [Oryza sativa Japonica Group]